ncbi:uncharacterized protein LOC119609160 [Lucilia sericata]|uniref:uncharacterized protein LOC119609160 n=1 Tax=Lucilia sericata TaxID=13632 RepID=UPI0018A82884|nr:uncharacterized protein LOC119609160 [Lucilia sericata]
MGRKKTMLLSYGKYSKYICLIVIVLEQLALTTVAGIKCIQCGDSEETCSTTLWEDAKVCPNKDQTKCFTQIDTSGIITRGCKTDAEAKACTADNNCIITGERKNNQLICKKCIATDEKCSQTDMNINDLEYNHICVEGVRRCIKKVVNKLVVRDCATENDIQQCTDSKTCETCDSINCNTGVFPKGRITCYQCTGSSCEDITANNIVDKVCANYEENDQCYMKAKNENDMTRGCKSDTRDNECLDAAEGCVFCSNNNCNNLKYIYDQVLKCHQCTSDVPTNKCFDKQTTLTANTGIFPKGRITCYQCTGSSCEDVTANNIVYKVCANYEENDQCYTVAKSEIDMTRGCKSDTRDNECLDAAEGCVFCSNNNCNNLKYIYDQVLKCHQCTSDDITSECFDKQTSKVFEKCKRQIRYNFPEYCYTQINGNTIKRGCLHDNLDLTLDLCQDIDSDTCSKCNNRDGCNSEKETLDFTCIGKHCRVSPSSPKEGCFHGIWHGDAIRGV